MCVPWLDRDCRPVWDTGQGLNWDDGATYWTGVGATAIGAVTGPVQLLYGLATDEATRADLVRGAQYVRDDWRGAAWDTGGILATPFTDMYSGIVCGDSNQLGRGLTAYALMLGGARLGRRSGLDLPRGARGPASRRPFNPETAGGPIRALSTGRVRITHRGIDVVEQHLARFEADAPNTHMLQRLRRIASGEQESTVADVNFYTHELREYVRYRNLGWESGAPPDRFVAHDLWNDTHTATLEDYRLREGPGVLYHPDFDPYAR